MDYYRQSYGEALELNSVNKQKWLKYKKELVETKDNLKEFVKSRSINIMVPMGKKAFVRGSLQHTNEITVSHGSSLFSDVSSAQAVEILEHRIKLCETQLQALDKEKELFTNKVKLPEDVFESSEGREIIEQYNEDEEKAWRRKHIESIRRQKQRESEERKKQLQNDVDINKIFDEYEMIEELADELDSLDIDDDEKLSKIMNGEMKVPESKTRIAHNLTAIKVEPEEVSDISSTKSPSEDLSHRIKPLEINNNDLITQNNQEIVDLLKTYRCKIKDVLKNVKKDDERNINLFLDLIELKDDIEDDIRKMNDDEEYSESDETDIDGSETENDQKNQRETKRKVRFSTSLEDVKLIESKSEPYLNGHHDTNTIQINFKHSNAKFTNPSLPDDNTIASPADIYKLFHSTKPVTLSPATKSILKNKGKEISSPTIEDEKSIKKIFHSDLQVMGDVVEHKKDEACLQEEIVHIMAKDDAPKKVSKFKQMRMKS